MSEQPVADIDTLALWDIDGTLLSTARAGIRAWEDAVHAVVGEVADLTAFETAGLTDRMIAADLLATYGGDPSDVTVLVDAYAEHLLQRLTERRGGVLPGVIDVLEGLRLSGRVYQCLLTGNTRRGADIKLRSYGLETWFTEGAFAEDGVDRAAIGAMAIARASRIVGPIAPSRTFVIGDTPLDVECGHLLGVRTIAVATGEYSVEELRAHDPWWVVPRLLPAPEFVARLLDA